LQFLQSPNDWIWRAEVNVAAFAFPLTTWLSKPTSLRRRCCDGVLPSAWHVGDAIANGVFLEILFGGRRVRELLLGQILTRTPWRLLRLRLGKLRLNNLLLL
jgi:hypothetical protein